jgi:uncharacterized membrane protein SpoIIM required for sporulation/ABC-type transport system involved in multi-copper enzyme maturation permease subunit
MDSSLNSWKHSVAQALVITRRELRDQFRDWRIVVPIIILTLVFPLIMNITAASAVNFVNRYNAQIVADRLIPFLLMVVGFFPLSISLVIALESFVGEKERHSIEPLLCSPLSDFQLYFGKLLASTMLPVSASLMGIVVYLIGVMWRVHWRPEPIVVTQIVLMTLVQAVLMVSGAVVISTQTTSVRAANLLSSFIVVPMALLIQGESIVMFWGIYSVLWWAIIGQMVITGLLVRTGMAYFNREEMLGRELDILDLRGSWGLFKRSLRGRAVGIASWYRLEVWPALKELRLAMFVMFLGLLLGVYAGINLSEQFPLPANMVRLDQVDQGFVQGLELVSFYSPAGVLYVWLHNLRAMLFAAILGVFSFGVLSILVLMLPVVVITYVAANIAATGGPVSVFLLALVAPHGLLEFPAIIIGGAAILGLGATLTAPAHGKTLGEAMVINMARMFKVMIGVVIPLFFAAALIEVFITPHVAVWLLAK